MHVYWSQLFTVLAKVLNLINAYCSSYLWSGTNVITKKARAAWEKCLISGFGTKLPLLKIVGMLRKRKINSYILYQRGSSIGLYHSMESILDDEAYLAG